MFCGKCSGFIPDGVPVCPRCGAPAEDEFEDFDPGSSLGSGQKNTQFVNTQPTNGYNNAYGMMGADPVPAGDPMRQNGFSGPQQSTYVGHHESGMQQNGGMALDPYMGNRSGGPAVPMPQDGSQEEDWSVEHRRTRKKGGFPVVPVIIGIAVLIIAAAAVLWLMLSRTDDDAAGSDNSEPAAAQEIGETAATEAPLALDTEETADETVSDTAEQDGEDPAAEVIDSDELYTAADGFEDDNAYIIVIEDADGNYYAVSNNDGQLGTEAIEMDGDGFADDLAVQQNSTIRWNAEEPTDTRDNKVRVRLENSGRYLNVNADETALELNDDADKTRWYYDEAEGLNYLPGSDSEDAENTWVIADTDFAISTEGGLTVHIYTIAD